MRNTSSIQQQEDQIQAGKHWRCNSELSSLGQLCLPHHIHRWAHRFLYTKHNLLCNRNDIIWFWKNQSNTWVWELLIDISAIFSCKLTLPCYQVTILLVEVMSRSKQVLFNITADKISLSVVKTCGCDESMMTFFWAITFDLKQSVCSQLSRFCDLGLHPVVL